MGPEQVLSPPSALRLGKDTVRVRGTKELPPPSGSRRLGDVMGVVLCVEGVGRDLGPEGPLFRRHGGPRSLFGLPTQDGPAAYPAVP